MGFTRVSPKRKPNTARKIVLPPPVPLPLLFCLKNDFVIFMQFFAIFPEMSTH